MPVPLSLSQDAVLCSLCSSRPVGAMAPGKRVKKDGLELSCEWGRCQFSTARMEEFCEHAREHLEGKLQVRSEEEEEHEELLEEHSCLWLECGFCTLDNPVELARHVYFHCYHTKLKQWGLRTLQGQPHLGSCMLDYQNRNIIPEIQDNLVCLWEHCEDWMPVPLSLSRDAVLCSLCSSRPVGAMAPGKRVKKDGLELSCEWGRCQFSTARMEEFCEHAREHLEGKLQVRSEEEEEHEELLEEHSCLWLECGFCTLDNPVELARHVYFHCYHTKLKQWGLRTLQGQPHLGSCTLDYQNRNIIPEIQDNLVCLWEHCEDSFENPEWFYRHVDMHGLCAEARCKNSEDAVLPCGWKECEATFKSHFKLREHLRSHTQEKVVACHTCGGMFANNTKFFDHIRRQTTIEGQRFQCSHCSKRFATERLLRDHMRNHVSHYKCPLCDMTCPSPSSLRNHIKFRHSNEKPYRCEYCEYRTNENGESETVYYVLTSATAGGACLPTDPSDTGAAMEVDGGVVMQLQSTADQLGVEICALFRGNPYLCEYSCKNLIDLRKHLDTHSTVPAYSCEFTDCGFTARSVYSIKSHYKKVHEGDMTPRYKCHVCEKCFTRGNNLTAHLRKKHQFKWPSGHPRFRYMEHEDGYMRLQLIRYESVELTEQLMRERRDRQADTEGQCEEGEGLRGIVLETAEFGGSGEGEGEKGAEAQELQGEVNPIIHVQSRTNENGESETVYYVLTSATAGGACLPTDPSDTGAAMEVDGGVMMQLQSTADQLGVEIV
ncbi:UNVERIFIED_CONTAM: hypothetical protein FKN15_008919 [Acipenser sinensis]